MSYILIFFLLLPNQTTASVRIGFNSDATCAAGAREMASKLVAINAGAEITWACVQQ